MNLKNINWGVISAIIALVGIGLFERIVSQPTSDIKEEKKTDSEYLKEVDEQKLNLSLAESDFQELVWQTSRDEVGPKAMAWVSEAARAHFIDVRSFRPQRTTSISGVEQLNYLVTAEGSYLSVMEFLKVFESEDSLLAVKLIQVSSIDGASDLVRASIGLVAYMEEEENG